MTRQAPTAAEIDAGKSDLKETARLFWVNNRIVEKLIDHIDSVLEKHNFSDQSQCFGESPDLCDTSIPRLLLSEFEKKIIDHYFKYGYHCHITTHTTNIYFKLTPLSIAGRILGLK